MSSTKITEGDLYIIKKYVDLDVGIKEVCPGLLDNRRIEIMCYQLKASRDKLMEELESMVVEEGSI